MDVSNKVQLQDSIHDCKHRGSADHVTFNRTSIKRARLVVSNSLKVVEGRAGFVACLSGWQGRRVSLHMKQHVNNAHRCSEGDEARAGHGRPTKKLSAHGRAPLEVNLVARRRFDRPVRNDGERVPYSEQLSKAAVCYLTLSHFRPATVRPGNQAPKSLAAGAEKGRAAATAASRRQA